MKKFIPLLNIVLVLSMLLAACGPRTTEAPTESPVTPTPEPSGRVLSREEAVTRLIEKVIEPSGSREWADAYGLPEPLPEGAEVWPYLSEESVSISEPTWFFWVDDMPEAKFAHPTRFVFIDAESNQLTVLQAQWWPVVNGESLWANVDERLAGPCNVYRGLLAFPDPTLYPREEPETSNRERTLPFLAIAGPAFSWLASYTPKTGTRYAILVAGDEVGASKRTIEAFRKHLTDVEKYDVKNIEVLNPAKRTSDIAKAFDRIINKKRIKAGDTLIFFYDGHGAKGHAVIGQEAGIHGPEEGSLWYGLKTGQAEYRFSIEGDQVQDWEAMLNNGWIDSNVWQKLEIYRTDYEFNRPIAKGGPWSFTVGKGDDKQEFRIRKVGKKLEVFAVHKKAMNQNSLAYNLRRLPKGVNVIVIIDACKAGSAIDLLKGNNFKAEVFTAADKESKAFWWHLGSSDFTEWLLKGKENKKGDWEKGFKYAKGMIGGTSWWYYLGLGGRKDSKPQHDVIRAYLGMDKVTIYVKIKTDGKPLSLKGAKVTISGKDLTGKPQTIKGVTNNKVGKFVTDVPRGLSYDIKASYKDKELDCGSRTIKVSILSDVSYTVYLTCKKLTKPSEPPEPVQPAPAPEEPTVEPTEEVRPPCVPDAAFGADVTVPDGTFVGLGECFEKTWRLRNSGGCIWEVGYTLTFISGDQMGAPDEPVPLTMPGDTADISVTMCAPEEPGTYRSGWRMRDASGQIFGPDVYVEIVVPDPALAKEYVEECHTYLEQGKPLLVEHTDCTKGIRLLQAAGEKCSTALELDPNNAKACFYRGMARRWLEEELNEAIEDLQCALDKGLEGDQRTEAERELAGLRDRLAAPISVSMGPVICAEDWTENGQPINPRTTFPTNVKQICCRWDLYNPRNEVAIEKWYWDGELDCQQYTDELKESWTWYGGCFTADEGESFEPATSCVEVWIGATKMTEGCFTVTDQAVAPPTSASPTILSIDFPSQIPADGTGIDGSVRFKDPDGDVNRVTFDVVSASDFDGFEFNLVNYLIEGDATDGVFSFHTWSKVVQQVTLQAILHDAAGNSSDPFVFSFVCE